MLDFNAIYFDTEPLIHEGWPSLSNKLGLILAKARLFELPLYLPKAVKDELEAHWNHKRREERTKIENALRKFNKTCGRGAMPAGLDEFLSEEQALNEYRVAANNAKRECGFRTIGTTKRSAENVFQMALMQQPPFKANDAGFKDTVIFLSVVEHLAAKPGSLGAFVSRDGGFVEEELAELTRPLNVNCRIFRAVDDLDLVLSAALESRVRERYEQEATRVKTALEGQKAEIKAFLESNLELSATDVIGSGYSVRVDGITGIEIVSVYAPIPSAERTKEAKGISFDVNVTLGIVQLVFGTLHPRTFKVGGKENTEQAVIFDYILKSPVPQFVVVECIQRVEVEAKMTKGESGLRFEYAAARKKRSLGARLASFD